MPVSPSHFAEFGDVCFDLKRRVLTRGGDVVPLAPKDLEILLVLLQSPDHIVEKREIMEKVWPDTFVEEANLSRHIFNLRRVLAKDGERFIATIPKRGYRLAVPVKFRSAAPESDVMEPCFKSREGEQVNRPAIAHAGTGSVWWQSAKNAILHWRSWVFIALVFLLTGVFFGLLRGMTSHTASIAVLPVQNFTGDPSKDYICDGLTEELIVRVTQTAPKGVHVVPRTSSMAYKTSNKTVAEIARELQVGYVVEGSLRESSGRFRITEEVIRLPQEDHVFAREYDEIPSDALAVEDDVSQSVANVLMDLTPAREHPHGSATHADNLNGKSTPSR